MREESLNDRILRVLAVARRPMAAIEIRRALPDAVEASEVASRLNWYGDLGSLNPFMGLILRLQAER